MAFSGNLTPNSSYIWNGQRDWIVRDNFYYQITAPGEADASHDNRDDLVSKPLREKNSRKNGKYIHVPHRDKPPQVVARRNARERRRVQAVNGAFMRLRKAVPFQNNRGKRVSKVKTLQNAIQYIQNLQELLRKDGFYDPFETMTNYYYNSQKDMFGSINNEDDFETDDSY